MRYDMFKQVVALDPHNEQAWARLQGFGDVSDLTDHLAGVCVFLCVYAYTHSYTCVCIGDVSDLTDHLAGVCVCLYTHIYMCVYRRCV